MINAYPFYMWVVLPVSHLAQMRIDFTSTKRRWILCRKYESRWKRKESYIFSSCSEKKHNNLKEISCQVSKRIPQKYYIKFKKNRWSNLGTREILSKNENQVFCWSSFDDSMVKWIPLKWGYISGRVIYL